VRGQVRQSSSPRTGSSLRRRSTFLVKKGIPGLFCCPFATLIALLVEPPMARHRIPDTGCGSGAVSMQVASTLSQQLLNYNFESRIRKANTNCSLLGESSLHWAKWDSTTNHISSCLETRTCVQVYGIAALPENRRRLHCVGFPSPRSLIAASSWGSHPRGHTPKGHTPGAIPPGSHPRGHTTGVTPQALFFGRSPECERRSSYHPRANRVQPKLNPKENYQILCNEGNSTTRPYY
jgi:hypothetical protein